MKTLSQIIDEHIASLSEEEKQKELASLLKREALWRQYVQRHSFGSEKLRLFFQQFVKSHGRSF